MSRRRFPCYICLNQILDFGKVHLDLHISKKLMPNDHQTAFQNFYFYNKMFHVFRRTHGPIFSRVAFRKFWKCGAYTDFRHFRFPINKGLPPTKKMREKKKKEGKIFYLVLSLQKKKILFFLFLIHPWCSWPRTFLDQK